MDTNKSDTNIEINISSADIQLGVANILIALHQCGMLEMPKFIEALKQVNSHTNWKGQDGQPNQSQFSQKIIQHLNQLSKLYDNEGK